MVLRSWAGRDRAHMHSHGYTSCSVGLFPYVCAYMLVMLWVRSGFWLLTFLGSFVVWILVGVRFMLCMSTLYCYIRAREQQQKRENKFRIGEGTVLSRQGWNRQAVYPGVCAKCANPLHVASRASRSERAIRKRRAYVHTSIDMNRDKISKSFAEERDCSTPTAKIWICFVSCRCQRFVAEERDCSTPTADLCF